MIDQQIQPQCVSCKYLDFSGKQWKCKAFPRGVPEQIKHNELDHRKQVPGDHGIRWEPLDKFAEHPFVGVRGAPVDRPVSTIRASLR